MHFRTPNQEGRVSAHWPLHLTMHRRSLCQRVEAGRNAANVWLCHCPSRNEKQAIFERESITVTEKTPHSPFSLIPREPGAFALQRSHKRTKRAETKHVHQKDTVFTKEEELNVKKKRTRSALQSASSSLAECKLSAYISCAQHDLRHSCSWTQPEHYIEKIQPLLASHISRECTHDQPVRDSQLGTTQRVSASHPPALHCIFNSNTPVEQRISGSTTSTI